MVDVDPQLQDHAVGLELGMVGLAGRADQAAHEGWPAEEAGLGRELDQLYAERARVAERLAEEVGAAGRGAEVAAEPARVYARH